MLAKEIKFKITTTIFYTSEKKNKYQQQRLCQKFIQFCWQCYKNNIFSAKDFDCTMTGQEKIFKTFFALKCVINYDLFIFVFGNLLWNFVHMQTNNYNYNNNNMLLYCFFIYIKSIQLCTTLLYTQICNVPLFLSSKHTKKKRYKIIFIYFYLV